MGKLATPFRVGLLVIVAVVIFALSFSFVHKGGLTKKEALKTVAYFHDASGLGPKSRVQIAGISVGEIEKVELEGQLAKVTLLIKRDNRDCGVPSSKGRVTVLKRARPSVSV